MEMVFYFIDIYVIKKKTLRDLMEVRNFSSGNEKIFHSFAALTRRSANFIIPQFYCCDIC